MSIPKQAAYVVVGAGIHGLSTAYHLAKELRTRGPGSGADVVVARQVAARAPARPGSPAASSATTTSSRR